MSDEKIVVTIRAGDGGIIKRIEDWGSITWDPSPWVPKSWTLPKGFSPQPPKAKEGVDKCERCKEELKHGGLHGPKDTAYEGKLICGNCECELLQEKRNHELKVQRGEIEPEPEEGEDDDNSKIVIKPYWGTTAP